jgi:hypothetical protein
LSLPAAKAGNQKSAFLTIKFIKNLRLVADSLPLPQAGSLLTADSFFTNP